MEKETESSKLVIDSNIFVDYLRNYPSAIEFFKSLLNSQDDISFSAITETELIAGKSCNDSNVRNIVLNMLNGFNKIEVNNQIALRAGDLCRLYEIALPDSVIAATALVYKADLLTKNLDDFKGIEGLKVKKPY